MGILKSSNKITGNTLITLLLSTKLEKGRFSLAHFTDQLQIIGQGINEITVALQDYLIWKGGAENFPNWLFYVPFHNDFYRDRIYSQKHLRFYVVFA